MKHLKTFESFLTEASLVNWVKDKFKKTPNEAKANKLKRDWLGRFGIDQEKDFNKLIDKKGNISKKDYLNLMRKHYDFGDNDPQTQIGLYTPWIKYFNPNLQDEIDNLPDRYL